MTVIVSVKINEGIVMASDSASTFGNGQTYTNANKIANLRKGLPIGVMVTGDGGIGSESLATLLKDLRRRLAGEDDAHADWQLDPQAYSMEAVAGRVRTFLYEEKAAARGIEASIRLRLCGYSARRPLPEIWEVNLRGGECDEPFLVRAEDHFGVNWDGEYDALNRLIFGVGVRFPQVMAKLGHSEAQIAELSDGLVTELYETLALPTMPIQDAIDLARFLVKTTIGFIRFAVARQPKTVGGPIEIATVTKHEGFRWVRRNEFFPAKLNLPLP